MKKALFGLLLLVFLLGGCSKSPEEILQKALESISFPGKIEQDLELSKTIKIGRNTVNVTWKSDNPEIISNEGKLNKTTSQNKVKLDVTLEYEGQTLSHQFDLIVPSMSPMERINYVLNQINLPTETKTDLFLPRNIERVAINWSSSNSNVISESGVITEVNNQTEVTLTAKLSYMGESLDTTFIINVIPLTTTERLEKAIDQIDLYSGVVFENLTLQNTFPYGITGEWTSSNPDVISNDGIINLNQVKQSTTLTLELTLEGETMTKTYEFKIGSSLEFNNHTYIERVQDFDTDNLLNLEVKNDKLVLKEGITVGTYVSNKIDTLEFKSAVASWSALSGPTCTVEILVRVYVDGQWSDYLSYTPWGLGLQNKANNQISENNVARLTDDIISISNDRTANAFQFKAVLRRLKDTDPTPELSLVAVTLDIPNYEFPITTELPNFVDYDVPKLNQNIVPTIGNSICSPTSVTMLLKYKGHSFTEYDEFEHRYIAGLARDYGNNIFGNWVFNTVTASSFGHDAYVKQLYSFEELMHHLHTVGPVAASVKGDMQGLYTTNGHLIVVRGYRVTPEKTTVITNDPNLKDVNFEYDLDVFMRVWRNVIYVIE